MERAGEDGIAQSLPTAFKNTWDFLVGRATASRRRAACRTTTTGWSPSRRSPAAASPRRGDGFLYGSTSGLVPGDFVFLEFGLANEEHANVISVDTVNQNLHRHRDYRSSGGIEHPASIWPTAVLLEGNDLAFDIKAVASPDAGSDLTVVIQT